MSHEEQPLPIGRDLRLGDGRAGHPHDLDFGAGHHIVPFQGAEGREKYLNILTISTLAPVTTSYRFKVPKVGKNTLNKEEFFF